MQMLRCLNSVHVCSTFRSARTRNCHRKGRKWAPHHSKRNGGQEGNGEEGKRAGGHGYRQNENTILYNTEHTHTHTHFFSEYRLLWISLYALLILSLYVCIYTYKAIHHTHTDTHTFSVYVCLSFVCVCDRERGGVPSLSRKMCCTLKGFRELRDLKLHLLMLLTQSGTIHGISDFWERRESDRERETRHWNQDFPCTSIHALTFAQYNKHFHTTQTHKK